MVIESKELGIQIAETKEQALWLKLKEATTMRIEALEESLFIEKAFLELIESKILPVKNVDKGKNGV